MKKILILLCISLVLTACSNDDDSQSVDNKQNTEISNTQNQSSTDVPKATPTPTPEQYSPADPLDEEGRAVAVYATPIVDGIIDPIWEKAGIIVPDKFSSQNVQASGEFRLLWDDNALYTLYIVKDPDINKTNINAYEQDSVEIFLDEANDKASSYQNDDVHYRVNYENTLITDAGDPNRFFTATASLTDADGIKIGYIVESGLTWEAKAENNRVMGFDLQINDADSTGVRIGTVNIFDQTGAAWSNPSSMGEIILIGKEANESELINPYKLSSYLKYAEGLNSKGYVNSDILTNPINTAKKVLDKESVTQEEINIALEDLRQAVSKLDDGSGFVKVDKLDATSDLTDHPFSFLMEIRLKQKRIGFREQMRYLSCINIICTVWCRILLMKR